ncbi:2 4-dihydroxyhept-2-ene-1 7-dioic acid aldolase [Paramagnetospirillum magnetotacticum MS-1]|uniref:2 4-dihydroxyhept-2-ene-1 7-dioic acid aldolase n=1 Tax=Paramagnetospirillum magnetotacticum MS-1 TaxID=272627 RepID=A0A0C2YVS4_PARME|nr:4-hydroxy-2-oxoheptanedioate aldolase [Paramagnetospirillum magnetotacticum]KIL99208.1 2 4-dihydroxyhept-2-ene-1 7-dioic acid aldolase [Paramagnetospirillum magnetotacticum MS-1]
MQLPQNPFKRALAEGRKQIGLWVGLANPYTAEICAGAGFDWLLIDGEHAPNDVPLLLAQLQAVAPYPSHPIVRPVIGDTALIKQLLDIGAQTLLVPMIDTPEQAAATVAAMHYPPRGVRGVGAALARASRWGRVGDYLKTASDELCLLLQIETVTGLRNLEAIATTDGVDGIFIGPADLAASLGHLGAPSHPEVQAEIEKALATLNHLGVPSGILAADETLARKYLAAGATFVAVGIDTMVLARGLSALAATYKDIAPAPQADRGGY